tara:strand:- start:130 stop:528 length:399 start_codon:yes stop_codon:yes gene_type:complete
MKFVVILSAFFVLSACATEFAELNIGKHSSEPINSDETADKQAQVKLRFNDMQLRKLQVGLVSQDVLEILGKPDETSKQTCGKDGFFYKCAIWRYGEKEAGQANVFFNRDFKRLYLIRFNIEELSSIPLKFQ